MDPTDDDLLTFASNGARALPVATEQRFVEHEGARIWCASFGTGPAVLLLHGGLGHGGNFGYQVPALVAGGYRVVLIDSRGHGRSTRDERPFSYELLASDALAVLDSLELPRAHVVGWSDGACTGLIAAAMAPKRIASVFFFACNMDPSGVKEFVFEPDSALGRCFARHAQDYRVLSPTPADFEAFSAALDAMMRSQPNYAAADLTRIEVPVAVVQSERDEFIKPEHAAYLARTLGNARLVQLPGVSHFAPLQRPALFNEAMLQFLDSVAAS